jgi:hypothetical protein
MNNRENIFNFLNRYYRIELGKFFDIILEKNVFGSVIVEHLIAVYSIDEEICKVLFTEWALTNMTSEDFENNWQFKRTIPEIAAYEPKRMNRFLITFPEHFNIPQWVVVETSRPNMTIKSKKILGFELFKKIIWTDMLISMRDPIGPSTSQSFMDLIHKSLYEKKQIIKDKFDLKLEMLDPTGVVVERWDLSDCKFKSIDFGELSYQNDDMVKINLVIKLGKVILEF